MPKMVTLTIDGQSLSVPEGTLIVDAAKQIGIDIPVFCYHPKMEPVGMCRMCLVEIGRPVIDRTTGQPQLEANGSPRIQFGPKLETACTTPVSAGMVVLQGSEKVKEARKDVLEFLLTSHPLDCPICDKGGECPLQNLTLGFGPGQSRFVYAEKMHLEKRMPLGDLILLDRERCIQCARCVRFQSDIAEDPVIGFYQRGRKLEIVTYSDPGFDSYFSGNTTDICPVGALTTVDFRFGARPWELRSAASICTHCPVGCNITFNVRREAKIGGKSVIKRVMPRQNEAVNEIWMCDKGRFAYHFTESDERLTQPLVREGEKLVPASWDAALERIAGKIKAAGSDFVVLASGRLANEDLFNLKQLAAHQGGQALLYTHMSGGHLTAQVGLGQGSNLSALGKGSVILVAACDLEEEAPVWWLRVNQAAKRGATLIVANPRPTKLDRAASIRLPYAYGEEAAAIRGLLPGATAADSVAEAASVLAKADNLVVFYGSEGLGLEGSEALARACAGLLVATGHTGKPNNGLIAVWPRVNEQGAWDTGFHPAPDLARKIAKAGVVLVAAADPAGDDPALANALDEAAFVVVQELFLTETAKKADVVLPAQAFTEREGTFTSGERRVQRFYPALPARPGPLADFAIAAGLAGRLGLPLTGSAASLAFAQLADQLSDYAGLTYQRLAESAPQWPIVGREDLYYGGTGYDNHQGLGVQLAPAAQRGLPVDLPEAGAQEATAIPAGAWLAVPVTRLYDRGRIVLVSPLLRDRLVPAGVLMNPADAQRLGAGEQVWLGVAGQSYPAAVTLDEGVPVGVVLVPRSVGLPVAAPMAVTLSLHPVVQPA